MILLVDDNRVSREAFGKILRLYGHDVLEAAQAAEALDILNKVHVDVVITDFVMPKVNGVQLIEQIRRRWPDTRIVLTSGYLTPEVGQILSADLSFLPKPVDISVLLETIRRISPQSQSL